MTLEEKLKKFEREAAIDAYSSSLHECLMMLRKAIEQRDQAHDKLCDMGILENDRALELIEEDNAELLKAGEL